MGIFCLCVESRPRRDAAKMEAQFEMKHRLQTVASATRHVLPVTFGTQRSLRLFLPIRGSISHLGLALCRCQKRMNFLALGAFMRLGFSLWLVRSLTDPLGKVMGPGYP